jgi:hypothetical protein
MAVVPSPAGFPDGLDVAVFTRWDIRNGSTLGHRVFPDGAVRLFGAREGAGRGRLSEAAREEE